MPGTITPKPIRAPEPIHTSKPGETSVSCSPPTIIRIKIKIVETVKKIMSFSERPSLPAVL